MLQQNHALCGGVYQWDGWVADIETAAKQMLQQVGMHAEKLVCRRACAVTVGFEFCRGHINQPSVKVAFFITMFSVQVLILHDPF